MEVRDARDVVLGVGSTSVAVTIDAAALADGKAKAEALAKLKADAAAAWADGDLDAACDKGKAAAAIDRVRRDGDRLLRQSWANPGAGVGRQRRARQAQRRQARDRQGADDYDQARAINAKAKPLADLAAQDRRRPRRARQGGGAARRRGSGMAGRRRRVGRAKGASALAAAPKSATAQVAAKRYADALAALQAARTKAKAALDRGDADGALAAVAEGKKTLANDKPLLQLEQTALKAKADESQCRQTAADGLVKQQTGDASGALVLYHKALEACPQLCAALANSAAAYDATGDKAAAKQAAAKALSCDPSDKDIRSIAAHHGVAPPAPADLKDPGAWCHELEVAAVALHNGGDVNGAIPIYKQALAVCPKSCMAMSDLALADQKIGDSAAAKSAMTAALACDPANKTIQDNAAKIGVSTATTVAGAWSYVGVNDCLGHDVGSTNGAAPSADMCRPGVGTAVCWDAKCFVDNGAPHACCTYKNVAPGDCNEHGPNASRIYACSLAAAQPPQPGPDASKSDAQKACEALLASAKKSVAQNDRLGLAGVDAKLRNVCPPACLSVLAVPKDAPRPACLDDYKAVFAYVNAGLPTATTSTTTPPAHPEPMQGLWDTTIVGSVHVQLDIRQDAGAWTVRFFGRDGWEIMADVRVDPAKATLSFRRPLAKFGEPDQTYAANVVDGVMHGTFNGGNAWEGHLTNAAPPPPKPPVVSPSPVVTPPKPPVVIPSPVVTPPTNPPPRTDAKSCDDAYRLARQIWMKADDRRVATGFYRKAIAICPSRCDIIGELSGLYHDLDDGAASKFWWDAAEACGNKRLYAVDRPPPSQADAKVTSLLTPACADLHAEAAVRWSAKDVAGAIDIRKKIAATCPTSCENFGILAMDYDNAGDAAESRRWRTAAEQCKSGAAPPKPPVSTPQQPADAAGEKKACEAAGDAAERADFAWVASKEPSDAKVAIAAYQKAAAACQGREDECLAMAHVSSFYGALGDAASAAAWKKNARDCEAKF